MVRVFTASIVSEQCSLKVHCSLKKRKKENAFQHCSPLSYYKANGALALGTTHEGKATLAFRVFHVFHSANAVTVVENVDAAILYPPDHFPSFSHCTTFTETGYCNCLNRQFHCRQHYQLPFPIIPSTVVNHY